MVLVIDRNRTLTVPTLMVSSSSHVLSFLNDVCLPFISYLFLVIHRFIALSLSLFALLNRNFTSIISTFRPFFDHPTQVSSALGSQVPKGFYVMSSFSRHQVLSFLLSFLFLFSVRTHFVRHVLLHLHT